MKKYDVLPIENDPVLAAARPEFDPAEVYKVKNKGYTVCCRNGHKYDLKQPFIGDYTMLDDQFIEAKEKAEKTKSKRADPQ